MSRAIETFWPRAALAVAATLVLGAGTALAGTGPGPDRLPPRFVPTTVSKRIAHRDMERRLRLVVVPAWGKRVGARSAAPRLRGRYPILSSWERNLYWSSDFIALDAGVPASLRWFVQHPPAGAELLERITGPGHGYRWYQCLVFLWPDGRPATGERVLFVCATKHRGGTSIRVDSEAVWLEGRSPLERIPGGSRLMEIVASKPGRPSRTTVVSDPKLIAHVVALVNSLPLRQNTSYSCAHGIAGQKPPHPAIELIFRANPEGGAIAKLFQTLPVESGCRPMQFSLRGRDERSLDEGWLVLRALDDLVGER